MALALLAPGLDSFLGKPINDICTLGFADPSQNHCAHFVSHALGIQCATLCGDMQWETRHQGATIKVHELFNGLNLRGSWKERPANSPRLLVFVTSASNVRKNRMSNVPQKHVGIFCKSGIYNYSNQYHRVVLDSSDESFLRKFQRSYRGNDISLFYGVIP